MHEGIFTQTQISFFSFFAHDSQQTFSLTQLLNLVTHGEEINELNLYQLLLIPPPVLPSNQKYSHSIPSLPIPIPRPPPPVLPSPLPPFILWALSLTAGSDYGCEKWGSHASNPPPPAFLQHDCALSPYSGARPVSASLPLHLPAILCLSSAVFISLSRCFSI